MKELDARKLTDASIYDLRMRAIELHKKGYNMKAIADLLTVSYSAVRKWVGLYKQGREEALEVKKRGLPPGNKALTPKQQKRICSKIISKTPDGLNLPFGLWTCRTVQMLIEQQFNIQLCERQVGRYLKEWSRLRRDPRKSPFIKRMSRMIRKWKSGWKGSIPELREKLSGKVL